jgi:hypothetical protein
VPIEVIEDIEAMEAILAKLDRVAAYAGDDVLDGLVIEGRAIIAASIERAVNVLVERLRQARAA